MYVLHPMKDFTLPRRDLGVRIVQFGLLAVVLIRTVLMKDFKPVFLQDQAIMLKSPPTQL